MQKKILIKLLYFGGFIISILLVLIFRIAEKESLYIVRGEVVSLQQREVSGLRPHYRARFEYPVVKVEDRNGIHYLSPKKYPLYRKFTPGDYTQVIYPLDDVQNARVYSLRGFWFPLSSLMIIALVGMIWYGFVHIIHSAKNNR